MARRIAIIYGHPDPRGDRLLHALAAAYAKGAEATGHEVQRIDVAKVDFPLVRTKEEWHGGKVPASLEPAQEAIVWAAHLVILYPLWFGTMPALLQGFLEQVLRPGFAVDYATPGLPRGLLGGKSARIIVTMGMPALAYRWYFRAHSLKSLERNVLRLCGIGPIRESLFGMVEDVSAAKRENWLAQVGDLGRAGK
jgi:putative NADPH-quinone reductase